MQKNCKNVISFSGETTAYLWNSREVENYYNLGGQNTTFDYKMSI